jgi:hypothetical protein
MYDLELSRHERFLEKDTAWRRLLGRLDPDVRRDLIGWMGWSKIFNADLPASQESWSSVFYDYLVGASLVVDPLPDRAYEYYASDREALRADANAVGADMTHLHELLSEMIDRAGKTDSDGGRGRPDNQSGQDSETVRK